MTAPHSDSVILNVDDTEGSRYARTRTLSRAGFTVIEAATGAEALESARLHMPDLVLLDVKLPDINGFEVCRRLKADTQTRSILILQISASFLGVADKVQALDGGADNYLFEPVEPEELIANVKALVRVGRVERVLREAASRKDSFLATLGHELRNPLAPIRSAVAILQRLLVPGQDAQQKAVQIILRQTHQMARLVDDLLDVARITHGKIRLRLEVVDLNSVIDAAVESTAPIIEARQHGLEIERSPAPVFVRVDPVRLAQAVANLVHNAAKFTPKNGSIGIRVAVVGVEASIAVSDNGIGIATGLHGANFDLFSQAGHTDDRVQDGLGVGLSLVKALVEMHGGSVLSSSPGLGLGSAFEIRLPLWQAGAENAPHSAAGSAAEAAPTYRVLVVDDNEDSARALVELLELDGHRVEVCFNGTDAVARAREFRPEKIFLDIGLPDISGLEVARRILQMPEPLGCTLIALTGYGQAADAARIAAAGFHRHVIKPMDPSMLKELMG